MLFQKRLRFLHSLAAYIDPFYLNPGIKGIHIQGPVHHGDIFLIFLIFLVPKEASYGQNHRQSTADSPPSPRWQLFAVRGLNRSPLAVL